MAPDNSTNILVILCDQLRRDALGCYGDENVATPNVDALAARGVRFTCASSTYPICVPFRFSLMTGEYAHTRMVPGIEWRMSPAERTLADEFNEAGYETLYVGKWHLYGGRLHMPGYSAWRENREPVPRRFQGRWRHWRGFELRNDPFDTCFFVDDEKTPTSIETYQTDGLFDVAMKEMRWQQEADHRFVCMLSVEPPHPPYTAPTEYESKWRDRQILLPTNFLPGSDEESIRLLETRRMYYAMVENIDANVGRMTQFLDETGLAENTVVVFLSDHGELGGAHGLTSKQHPYEESVGIPLIVADPSVARSGGRTVDVPVNTEDLFPTLLGLGGLRPRNPLCGEDLSSMVRGDVTEIDREGVLLEFVSELRPSMPYYTETWRGVRTRRYKYTVLGDLSGGQPWQLFDLVKDPGETNNLLWEGSGKEMAAHHHQVLRRLLVETEDDFPLAPSYGCDGLNLYLE